MSVVTLVLVLVVEVLVLILILVLVEENAIKPNIGAQHLASKRVLLYSCVVNRAQKQHLTGKAGWESRNQQYSGQF